MVEGRTLGGLLEERGDAALRGHAHRAPDRGSALGGARAGASSTAISSRRTSSSKVSPERRGDSRVKVLDFGLAKAVGRDDGTLNRSRRHRRGRRRILGTPAYMSPEQAQGYRVDRRTDIWAFGCVLFEM